MSLLLDVLEVLARRAIGRVLLAHVAETAGKLREPLAIGALSEPADVQVIGLEKDWAGEEGYYGLCIVQRVSCGRWTTNNERRATGQGLPAGRPLAAGFTTSRSTAASGRKLRRSADQRQPEAIVRPVFHDVV